MARRKPGTDMNFRRSLPEIRCLSQGLPHATRCALLLAPVLSRLRFRSIIDSMGLPLAPDPATLRPLLRRDPVGALYMLADLEAPWFDECHWLVETEDGASAV